MFHLFESCTIVDPFCFTFIIFFMLFNHFHLVLQIHSTFGLYKTRTMRTSSLNVPAHHSIAADNANIQQAIATVAPGNDGNAFYNVGASQQIPAPTHSSDNIFGRIRKAVKSKSSKSSSSSATPVTPTSAYSKFSTPVSNRKAANATGPNAAPVASSSSASIFSKYSSNSAKQHHPCIEAPRLDAALQEESVPQHRPSTLPNTQRSSSPYDYSNAHSSPSTVRPVITGAVTKLPATGINCSPSKQFLNSLFNSVPSPGTKSDASPNDPAQKVSPSQQLGGKIVLLNNKFKNDQEDKVVASSLSPQYMYLSPQSQYPLVVPQTLYHVPPEPQTGLRYGQQMSDDSSSPSVHSPYLRHSTSHDSLLAQQSGSSPLMNNQQVPFSMVNNGPMYDLPRRQRPHEQQHPHQHQMLNNGKDTILELDGCRDQQSTAARYGPHTVNCSNSCHNLSASATGTICSTSPPVPGSECKCPFSVCSHKHCNSCETVGTAKTHWNQPTLPTSDGYTSTPHSICIEQQNELPNQKPDAKILSAPPVTSGSALSSTIASINQSNNGKQANSQASNKTPLKKSSQPDSISGDSSQKQSPNSADSKQLKQVYNNIATENDASPVPSKKEVLNNQVDSQMQSSNAHNPNEQCNVKTASKLYNKPLALSTAHRKTMRRSISKDSIDGKYWDMDISDYLKTEIKNSMVSPMALII